MALVDPYCDVATADTILAADAVWLALDESVKLMALRIGRYWMDANFQCMWPGADVPDEIQYANAWLAQDYATGEGLYDSSNQPHRLSSTSVTAGPVSSSKSYSFYASFRPASYAKISDILYGYCANTASTVVNLVRI